MVSPRSIVEDIKTSRLLGCRHLMPCNPGRCPDAHVRLADGWFRCIRCGTEVPAITHLHGHDCEGQ